MRGVIRDARKARQCDWQRIRPVDRHFVLVLPHIFNLYVDPRVRKNLHRRDCGSRDIKQHIDFLSKKSVALKVLGRLSEQVAGAMSMKRLESFWYEVSPYIFVIVGIGAVAGGNKAAVVFGVLLLLMSLLIIKMRWSYRLAVQSGRTQVARRTPRHTQSQASPSKRYRPGSSRSAHARARP